MSVLDEQLEGQCEPQKQENQCIGGFEDLGEYPVGKAIMTLKDRFDKGVNCRLRFYNKRTDSTHYFCHVKEISEVKTDENGIKWKRIS